MITNGFRIIGLILLVTAMWGVVPWWGWLGLFIMFLRMEDGFGRPV